MTDAAIAMIVSAASSFGAILLKMGVDVYRENRARTWDIEQREYDRKERLRVADELKAEQARIAQEMATKHEAAAKLGREATQHGIETIVGKIDENTEISVKAFDVANNVNEKLVAIGEARVKQHADRQTDRIEAVSKDTNEVVHQIAQDVKS